MKERSQTTTIWHDYQQRSTTMKTIKRWLQQQRMTMITMKKPSINDGYNDEDNQQAINKWNQQQHQQTNAGYDNNEDDQQNDGYDNDTMNTINDDINKTKDNEDDDQQHWLMTMKT